MSIASTGGEPAGEPPASMPTTTSKLSGLASLASKRSDRQGADGAAADPVTATAATAAATTAAADAADAGRWLDVTALVRAVTADGMRALSAAALTLARHRGLRRVG